MIEIWDTFILLLPLVCGIMGFSVLAYVYVDDDYDDVRGTVEEKIVLVLSSFSVVLGSIRLMGV